MKKAIWILLVAVLALSYAPAQAKKVKALYTPMTFGAPYFVQVGDGMKARGKELGWDVSVVDPKGDIAAQLAQLETAVEQKYDVIFLSALDSTAVKAIVKKAVDQGAIVITEATIVEGTSAHVGPGEDNMGRSLGEAMGKWAQANLKGTIEVATYHVTQDSHTLVREQGMRSGLETFYKNGKIDYVASLGGLTPEDGMKNMEGILQSHPNINIVMGCNDDSIMASYQAAKSAGVNLAKMGFGGVNAIPQALDLMKKEKASGKGAYRVTVDIIPFDTGKMCVDLAAKILKKQAFDKLLVVPAKAVTWANIDSYK
ncbi:MAG: sugar ABC transporter substrate-binding protein [Rectinemataceae bacterium]